MNSGLYETPEAKFLELKEVGASEVNGQWVHTFYYIQIRSELLETLKRIYTTYVFGMLLCLYFPLILNHVMSFILILRIISDLLILIKISEQSSTSHLQV